MRERAFRRYNAEYTHEHDRATTLEPTPELAPGKRTRTEGLVGPTPARRFQLAISEGTTVVPRLAAATRRGRSPCFLTIPSI